MKLDNEQVQEDLRVVLDNLVALTTTDSSGLSKESVKILTKYVD